MLSAALIFLGLIGLLVGSEIAVNAAKRIAAMLGVSPLLIGLTVTSIGTSLPEIATNLSAAFNSTGTVDASGLAVGNIMGSNISQITLLLGVTALFRPIAVPAIALRRDGIAMLAAIALMAGTLIDGETSRIEGMGLVLAYVAYLVIVFMTREKDLPGAEEKVESSLLLELGKTAVGLAIVVFSADLIIDNGVVIARGLGVSETSIGLVMGFATSLPELAVAIRGVQAGAGDLALGNLMGSNITDPLMSYGLGASVHAVGASDFVLKFDVPVWAGATVLALIFMATRLRLGRLEGAILMLGFVGYAGVRTFLTVSG